MVTRSFGVSVSISANGTIVLSLGEISADPGRLISAGEVVGSAGEDSSLGVHPGDARMVSSAPWVFGGQGSTPPIVVSGGWGNGTFLWNLCVFASSLRDSTF